MINYICMIFCIQLFFLSFSKDLVLFHSGPINFGDYLSHKLVNKIIGRKIKVTEQKKIRGKKLLAIGSILHFANDGDVVWGSGINGKYLNKHLFEDLDVRAVRGPLTRQFLLKMGIKCPEIYGDPALLLPIFFPKFKNNCVKKNKYIFIPHLHERSLFKQSATVVFPTENWKVVITKMMESELVISSALHGIIVAEAYGIPARLVRITGIEPLFKYQDYYYATGRYDFKFATNIGDALVMGGEHPPQINIKRLLDAFPWDFFNMSN